MLSSQIGEKDTCFGNKPQKYSGLLVSDGRSLDFCLLWRSPLWRNVRLQQLAISVIQTFDRFCSCDSYTDFIWYKRGGRTTIMMKMIMLILSLNDHDSLMYLIENQMLKSDWWWIIKFWSLNCGNVSDHEVWMMIIWCIRKSK